MERDGDLFVALCPELDIASQGATSEEAAANLQEAVEFFLNLSDPSAVKARMERAAAPEAMRSEFRFDYGKALPNRFLGKGEIQPTITSGVPPRIPAVPFKVLMRDLKRDRED